LQGKLAKFSLDATVNLVTASGLTVHVQAGSRMTMKKDRPDRQDQLHRLATLPDDRIDTADTPEASAEAWRHARRLRLKATALVVEELDGATFKALAASRIDARHDRLDAQMGTSPERGCYR
jgi:hypothetical protein